MAVKTGGDVESTKSTSNTTPFAATPLSQEFDKLLTALAPNLVNQLSNTQNVSNAATGINQTPASNANTNFSLDPGAVDKLTNPEEAPVGQPTPQSFDFISQLNNLFGGMQQGSDKLNNFKANINPQDSEFYKGLEDMFNRKATQNIADVRARFGGSGTSRGTPAIQAESIARADMMPALAATLGQARQGEVSNMLGAQGLDLQALLGGLGQQGNTLNSLISGFGTQRGQDIQNNQANAQNFLQNKNIDMNSLLGFLGEQNKLFGTQSNQSMFNAGQNNDMTKFFSNMQFEGNQNQINNQLQSLLSLLSGSIDLSKLGFGSNTSNKSTTNKFGVGAGFTIPGFGG